MLNNVSNSVRLEQVHFLNTAASLEAFSSYYSTRVLYTLVFSSVVFAYFWSISSYSAGNAQITAPFFGPKNYLSRWKFFTNAREYIQEGYNKCKDSPYKLSGGDIVVLPNKYVDELRSLPETIISSIQANVDNFEGFHSTTNLLLEGNLHTRTIQTRLTPKLATLVPRTIGKLRQAVPLEIPINEDGETVSLPAFQLVLRLVSHVAACHFVGYPTCENDFWLSTAMEYTENTFLAIIFLRIFPDWIKPLVSWFIPWPYRVQRALRRAQKIIVPVINERRTTEALEGENFKRPTDFLQMMMDDANEIDGQPDKLAHRLLILTLAAVHTTSMAATQTLFDLCLRPEYITILREEISVVLAKDRNQIKKTTLTHLKKMDSFMRESQRLHPPSLLGFKRATRQPLTLSDGLTLPVKSHVMMPVFPIVMDDQVTPEPTQFRGLRHYNNRQLPGEANKHQFATTSATNLHFGHGKFACPGRFFAATSIKLVLLTLLTEYDFDFAIDPDCRPADICVHEYIFPNPWAKITFKKKEKEDRDSETKLLSEKVGLLSTVLRS